MPLHQFGTRNVKIDIANFIILLFTYKKKRGRMDKNEFFRQLGLIKTQDVEKEKLKIELRREKARKEAKEFSRKRRTRTIEKVEGKPISKQVGKEGRGK